MFDLSKTRLPGTSQVLPSFSSLAVAVGHRCQRRRVDDVLYEDIWSVAHWLDEIGRHSQLLLISATELDRQLSLRKDQTLKKSKSNLHTFGVMDCLPVNREFFAGRIFCQLNYRLALFSSL